MQAVKDKEMCFLKAAKSFNVPRCTLLDCMKISYSEGRLSYSAGR
jgi:hypothetical protein